MDTKPMVTVQLPQEVHAPLKALADKRGVKLRVLLERLVRAYVERKEHAA